MANEGEHPNDESLTCDAAPSRRNLFVDKKGRTRIAPRPLAPLADSHGHLFSEGRAVDPPRSLERAALAGVALLVVPLDPTETDDAQATLDQLSRWQEEGQALLDEAVAHGARLPEFDPAAFGLASPTPSATLPSEVRIVAGVHPYGSASIDDACLGRLDTMLADPRCVGVGEFGLDFGPYNELPPEVQEQAFRAQLRLAHERGLPVELHIRDAVPAPGERPRAEAHELAVRVLEEEGVPAAGCDLHCFTSGPSVMAPFVELGCHIAFGGAATFAKSEDIRDAAAACPAELLLSETDAPYMAPVPLRGMPCEPAMIAFTAGCVADVRAGAGVGSRAETYRAFWDNARGFFGLAS